MRDGTPWTFGKKNMTPTIRFTLCFAAMVVLLFGPGVLILGP